MLKNLKPISLILLAGALSYPVASHAGITPVSYTHLDVYKRQGQLVASPTPV